MKKWIVIAMLAGAGLSASGEVLQEWKFDDAAGTMIRSCVNSGSTGTLLGWQSATQYAADGNGNLDVLAGDGGYATSDLFPDLAGSAGTYSLEIKVSEWVIQSANAAAQLNYRLCTATDTAKQIAIQARLDPVEGFGFTFICGNSNYRTHYIGGLTGSNAVARIDFNIAQASATYFLDGVEKETFSGLSIASIERFLLQKERFNPSPGTVLKVDEMNLSFVSDNPPEGAYIVSQVVKSDTVTASTNVVNTFDALVGDVIVVVSASTSKDEPGENSVVIGGGTAVIDPVVAGQANPNASCSTRYWYTTVTADGTVPVEQLHTSGAYWTMGAYQLRGGDGYTAPQLLGGPLENKLDSVGSIANSYTLGTNYAGVYIEALSAVGTGYWYPDNTNTVVSYGNQDKRNVAFGTFDGLATLENVWSSTNVNQVTLVGLAFGSLPDGIVATPQEQYNAWLAGFSVDPADAGMTVDADGDLLDNLTEYMWGGDPDNAASQGNTPVQSMVNDGGTDYLEYIYYELDDAGTRGLASICEVGTDLVVTNWADATGYETGRGASGEAGFDVVTNRIPTDVEAKQFIQLQIEFTP